MDADLSRIDRNNALARRKPDSSVPAFEAGSFPAAFAFNAGHAIGLSQRDAADARGFSRGEIIQLLSAGAKNSVSAAHPKKTKVILHHRQDFVTEQAVLACHDAEV